MTSPEFVQKLDPEEVFSLLAAEPRIEILRALWYADEDEPSFSELRETVGMADSGQFNYHLEKLLDHFIQKTENGYKLTEAGLQINGKIEAGGYTTDASMDPITLDSPCRNCGGELVLEYADDRVTVDCDTCFLTVQFAVPPSTFGDCVHVDVPDRAGRYLRTNVDKLRAGFCIYCEGPIATSIVAMPDSTLRVVADDNPGSDWLATYENYPIVVYECQQCQADFKTTLAYALLDHSAVASFHHRNDVAVDGNATWKFMVFGPDSERITDRNPFRASVTYETDGEEITVVVDERVNVVDIS